MYGRVGVPEEKPGEATGKSDTLITVETPSLLITVETVAGLPRTSTSIEWSQPEIIRL